MEKLNVMEKVFKILELLRAGGNITAQDIQNTLGVKRAASFRYLSYLERHNYIRPTEERGVYRVFNKTPLPEKSLPKFFTSLVNYYEKGQKQNDSVNPFIFIQKEGSSLEKGSAAAVKIEMIIFCINNVQEIIFTYKGKDSEYTADPYKIIFYEGSLYMLARHNERFKTFNLVFMNDIKAGENIYIPDYQAANKFLDAKTIWYDPFYNEKIVIKVSPHIADYFRARNILPNMKIIKEFKNGCMNIEFSVSSLMEFQNLMLGWFGYFKIISPRKYSRYLDDLIKQLNRKKI